VALPFAKRTVAFQQCVFRLQVTLLAMQKLDLLTFALDRLRGAGGSQELSTRKTHTLVVTDISSGDIGHAIELAARMCFVSHVFS
jgi:hypothetical protein